MKENEFMITETVQRVNYPAIAEWLKGATGATGEPWEVIGEGMGGGLSLYMQGKERALESHIVLGYRCEKVLEALKMLPFTYKYNFYDDADGIFVRLSLEAKS